MAKQLPDNFALPASMALFLDFDGTLVNFKDDPDSVYFNKNQTRLIIAINKMLGGALAIISGRDIRDLSKRVPKGLWRLGNHGLYAVAPYEKFCAEVEEFSSDLRQIIGQFSASFKGIWIEEKGPMLAIHHRANPAVGDDIVLALKPLMTNEVNLVLQRGNNVIEIKPRTANKGAALLRQMQVSPFVGRTPVMIGDDMTDEDGFHAAEACGGVGIKIGEGPTVASYRITQIDKLYELLRTIT